MKTVSMKYGAGTLDVSVPRENLLGVIEKKSRAKSRPEEDVVRHALEHPVGSGRLGEILKPGSTVAVVVSDVTRLWHRPFVYLPILVKEINGAGVPDSKIRFIGSIGLHRKQTPEEHTKILGPELAGRFKIQDHDPKDEANLRFLGTTSFGTPVSVNKTAMDCDFMILTGCCTYHPFFGWGGGKKSVMPGICGFESVQRNHRMVLSDVVGGGQRKEARNGNIEGNPVYKDSVEATRMANPAFLLNVIMGYDGKIARAAAGHWFDAHEHACGVVEELWGVPIPELGDLTIASQGGYPKDIEFYQTGKAIYNAQDSVKPGGTLIVLSECREGLGPEDARRIFLDFETTKDRESDVRSVFSVPKYVCWYICAAADKYNLIVVSAIEKPLLAKTNIRVVKTLPEALDLAYGGKGKDLKTWLMPLGSSVLPILKS